MIFLLLFSFIFCSRATLNGELDHSNTEIAKSSINQNSYTEVSSSGSSQVISLKKIVDDSTIPEMKTADVMNFLITQCKTCHSKDTGPMASFWPLDEKNLSMETLETDGFSADVYQSLKNKLNNTLGTEAVPMPPGDPLKDSEKITYQSLLKWFERNLPSSVMEAKIKYHGTAPDLDPVQVHLNFQCKQRLTIRTFLRKLLNDAFGRELTESDFDLFGIKDKSSSILSTQIQNIIVDKIFSDPTLKSDFIDYGLKKFAQKIQGTSEITKPEWVGDGSATKLYTDDAMADLNLEFYQLVKSKFENTSYKDILKSSDVMVTKNTAPLYENCKVPDDDWGKCTLQAPRKNFFNTVGFLLSKPSSFLITNNNYGRAAIMQFVISGDMFKAATEGPPGQTINPLPACLKSKDYRGKLNLDGSVAPYGSMKIPSTGNLCQSCHIARNMAAASILYRPFGSAGEVFKFDKFPKEHPDVKAYTGPGFVSRIEPSKVPKDDKIVDTDFLISLLKDSPDEQSCSPGGGTKKDIIFKSVSDFSDYLIGDGAILGKGLGKHLPRTLSNLSATTQDVIMAVSNGFQKNGGFLKDAIKSYFNSETYACDFGADKL